MTKKEKETKIKEAEIFLKKTIDAAHAAAHLRITPEQELFLDKYFKFDDYTTKDLYVISCEIRDDLLCVTSNYEKIEEIVIKGTKNLAKFLEHAAKTFAEESFASLEYLDSVLGGVYDYF